MLDGIEKLLFILKKTGKNYDLDKINAAYLYAKEVHEGHFRNSGEADITPPVAVAEIVAGLELDTEAICDRLVHDTVEDCPNVTVDLIRRKFGDTVADLVDRQTKLVHIPFADKEL